jgi:hypothetical protein
MAVFLIFAVPLVFGILLLRAYPNDYLGIISFGHLLRGVGIFVPAIILHFIIRPASPPAFTLNELIVHNIFFGHVQLFVLAVLGFALIYRFSEEKLSGYRVSMPFVIFSYFSGFYLLYGLLTAVIHFPRYRWNILFLEPALLVSLVLSATLLFQKGTLSYGYSRWLLFGASLVPAFLVGLAEALLTMRYTLAGSLVTAGLLLGSLGCFFAFGEVNMLPKSTERF